MADYGIWLSFDNQREGFQLPINPGEIAMSDGNTGTTYEINAIGQINVIKARKLTQYSFSSFFPAPNKGYSFLATNRLLQPKEYVDYITKWMESKRPIRFIFTGSTFDINEAVSIESFDWKEVAGGMGDIEYSLSLKKYAFYGPKRIVVQQSGVMGVSVTKEKEKRPDDRVPAKTYTMIAGDTLWKVAKSQLGDGSRWKDIQTLNGITDAEIKKLPIGKVLKLPDVRNFA